MKENIDHSDNFELPDSLKDLQGQNPFSVPEGFFEGQKAALNAIASPQAAAIGSASSWFSISKLAVAASVAAIITVTTILSIRNNDDTNDSLVDVEDTLKNELVIPQNDIEENTYTQKTPTILNLKEDESTLKEERGTPFKDNVGENSNESYAVEENSSGRANQDESPNLPSTYPNEDTPENSDQQFAQFPVQENSAVIAAHTSNTQNGSEAITKKENNIVDLGLSLGEDLLTLDPVRLTARTKVAKKPFYLWSTGETTSSIHVTKSGIYTVKVSADGSMNKCDFDTIKVTMVPRPDKILDKDIQLCEGKDLQLRALSTNENYEYVWNNGDFKGESLSLSNLDLGIHEFTLTILTCGETFEDDILIEVKNCDIKIPNVITPNGDGKNDYFIISGIDNFPGSQLLIQDRNGKLVYESKDYKNDWGAENLQDGVYFYLFIPADGTNKESAGTITVIRK